MSEPKTVYRCSMCRKIYAITPDRMLCDDCAEDQQPNEPLRGVLDVVHEDFRIDQPFGDLPDPRDWTPLQVGDTPLYAVPGLRKLLERHKLYVKYEGGNPTCSYKDRASALVAAYARANGIQSIVAASTGNAGSSIAGIGASCGLDVTLFLPKSAPQGKLLQSLQYGANLILVDGNYDLAYDLSLEYSRLFGGMNRNTGYNPLTIEGKKTGGVELYTQLNYLPDHVFVPTGDGVILSGIYKGFIDLKESGAVQSIPTLWAVQAAGSNALAAAFRQGHFEPIQAETLADSISVDVPRNGYHALNRLKENHGQAVEVSDEAILEAQALLSRTTGIFLEPAAAASLAGYMAVREQIPEGETVVLMGTGAGLKDPAGAMQGVAFPQKTIRSLEDLAIQEQP